MSLSFADRDLLTRAAAMTETAIDLCERAIKHDSKISSIEASDDAQSYRSVKHPFDAIESREIFAAALTSLNNRLIQIRAALEAAKD